MYITAVYYINEFIAHDRDFGSHNACETFEALTWDCQ